MGNVKNLITCFLLLILTSCSTVNNVEKLDKIITKDNVYSIIQNSKITPKEQLQIQNARLAYLRIKVKWQYKIDYNNILDSSTVAQLDKDFSIVKKHYLQIRGIVNRHYASYSTEQQKYLTEVDKEFKQFNNSFNKAKRVIKYKKYAKLLIKITIKAARIIGTKI